MKTDSAEQMKRFLDSSRLRVLVDDLPSSGLGAVDALAETLVALSAEVSADEGHVPAGAS